MSGHEWYEGKINEALVRLELQNREKVMKRGEKFAYFRWHVLMWKTKGITVDVTIELSECNGAGCLRKWKEMQRASNPRKRYNLR